MPPEDSSIDFKWPVSVERIIAAPAQTLWDSISRPENFHLFHPFSASHRVQSWPGPNSQDEIHYLSGWIYKRNFHSWIEGVGYDLEIGRAGGRKSSVSWRIRPVDDDSCALRITVCPHALQSLPIVIRWIPHAFWLSPLLRQYLDSVLKGVEWFVIRGQPVPRNAFGTHPWFSDRKAASN